MLLISALLVWPLAAFGGTSATTALPFGLVCILYAIIRRRRLAIDGNLDRALLVMLTIVAFQAIPLPRALAFVLSPHHTELQGSLTIRAARESNWVPLSIHVQSTMWAWIVAAGAIALFWITRADFRRGGIRRTVRVVAALGFAVSLLAVAQAATAGREIYWRFKTEFEGPLPFGPFVNRNHFATWIIMALPLCLGYLAARMNAPGESRDHVATRARLATIVDGRTTWLLTASATMIVALLLSLSRSGALALGASAALTLVLCRNQINPERRRRLMIAAGILLLFGLAWADLPALHDRLAGAQTGLKDRVTIWRETLPVVRDFWLTGTGAGTYQESMLVYQRSSRTLFFNQAHNHYLQVASEGGLLLTVALVLALAALVGVARRHLTSDTSGVIWIRIGAACGLCAVALQSFWETGLAMPANAALAAVLAAVVVHDRD